MSTFRRTALVSLLCGGHLLAPVGVRGETLDTALQAFQAGNYPLALSQARALTGAEPRAPEPWSLLARTLTETGDYRGALAAYRRLADLTAASDPAAEVAAARLEQLLGESDAARARMERVVEAVGSMGDGASKSELMAAGDADGVLACFWPAGRDFEDIQEILYADPSDQSENGQFQFQMKLWLQSLDPNAEMPVLHTEPTADNGLAFRLVLPLSSEQEDLGLIADTLNELELSGVDVPPAFGAWAVLPQFRSVGYIGFWPNCMYRPGTIASIASWCKIRSKVARQVIVNRS